MRGLTRLFRRPPRETRKRRFLLEMLPKHSVGAKIGVHLGEFSAQILEIVQPAELHLIDPWEHQTAPEYRVAWYGGRVKRGQAEMDERHEAVAARFAPAIAQGRVRLHRGYSDAVLETFPDGYFDWVYIDGNHFYEFVKKDLETSLRKTKVGGLVTGDDYAAGTNGKAPASRDTRARRFLALSHFGGALERLRLRGRPIPCDEDLTRP